MRLPRLIALPLAVAVAGLFAATPRAAHSAQEPWDAKVDRWVLSTAGAGPAEFLVYLTEQADVSSAHGIAAREDKGRYVTDTLRATAARTQGPLLVLFNASVRYRPLTVRGALMCAAWMALVAAVAWLSWRFYESPFLALKDRYNPRAPPTPTGD